MNIPISGIDLLDLPSAKVSPPQESPIEGHVFPKGRNRVDRYESRGGIVQVSARDSSPGTPK